MFSIKENAGLVVTVLFLIGMIGLAVYHGIVGR